MADIVNLRQVRKRRMRIDKERAAGENRRTHGRSAAERKEAQLAQRLDNERLEAHRRARPDGEEPC
jgi:hypothetical protein